jgi:hypothetical protein
MLTIFRKREPDKRDGIDRHGTRLGASLELKAVRVGIGAGLRALHSDVLCEEVPDRIAELLSQLDQPPESWLSRSGHREHVAAVSTGGGTFGKRVGWWRR